MSGSDCIKKVSCISLAGCSFGKFSAVKLCQSSSISGPSEMANPIEEKIWTISASIIDKGCLDPERLFGAGLLRSVLTAVLLFVVITEKREALSCSSFFSSLRARPTSFFSREATFLKSSNKEFKTPDFPRYAALKIAASLADSGMNESMSLMIRDIFLITLILFCVYLSNTEHKETIFMRNINFKSVLISFLGAFSIALFITSISSCEEESPTKAIITVINVDGTPAYDSSETDGGCKVVLSQQGLINSAGNESNVYKKGYTSNEGVVEFEFVNEAILNVEVEYTTGNDVFTSESVIKLVREELVRKTVIVN